MVAVRNPGIVGIDRNGGYRCGVLAEQRQVIVQPVQSRQSLLARRLSAVTCDR